MMSSVPSLCYADRGFLPIQIEMKNGFLHDLIPCRNLCINLAFSSWASWRTEKGPFVVHSSCPLNIKPLH